MVTITLFNTSFYWVIICYISYSAAVWADSSKYTDGMTCTSLSDVDTVSVYQVQFGTVSRKQQAKKYTHQKNVITTKILCNWPAIETETV